ncbi:SET domain-containing protein [Mycena venus]|uniref:SET domain-containing protein n=1 Tax=Mycena venus TaxID=2733690 RepID=A0A8H7CYS0_9AGAR|nr:SET domain-containing protein [Mycena venus]
MLPRVTFNRANARGWAAICVLTALLVVVGAASAMPGTLSPAYACGCLNVLITPVPHGSQQGSEPVSTPDFSQVYVADEGISIAHPQVTLRIRTRGELVTSRNRRARYTSLTCLICRVLVYRVHQIVSLDADGRDGPLMPTEDWVEQDILKSPSGWIEVHSQCLTGDAIARVKASPQYSALFSLAIPIESSPPTSPQPPAEDGPQTSFLAHLPPLFLPPPFTSGHPVFVHLAGLAKEESEAQRAAVEHEMAEIIRSKTAQLARTESRLRRQVETVWRRFRDGLQSVEQLDTSASLASPRSPHSPVSRSVSGTPGSPTISGTPTEVVRNFVPLPVAPTRQVRPPAISSLSASLATTGFHHPRAQREPTSPTRPASTHSSSSRTLSGSSITLAGSPRAQASTIAPARIFEDGSSVLQFPRATEDLNTAASYQYFRDLDADMARNRRERLERVQEGENVSTTSPSAAAPHRGDASEASRPGPSTVNANGNKNGVETPHHDENVQEVEASNVRDKGKGKQRKVTFQSQPAVVTISRDVTAEKEEEARLARNTGEEMIFDLEPDGKGRKEASESVVMVLVDQPAQPRMSQPRRSSRLKEPKDSSGLPQSFSGLRPVSLPLPSHLIPLERRPSPPEDPAPIPEEDVEEEEEEEEEVVDELDSRDQEIRKLVAADTPSHRGRWKKDSAEWKTLVSPNKYASADDDEEYDDVGPPPPTHVNGSSQAGMPSSMPINIRPIGNPRANLTLASYRPQTMPPAPQEAEPEPAEPLVPSSSIRRAVYAERDLQRARDPGALDFAADGDSVIEEEDEEEAGEHDHNRVTVVGSAPIDGEGTVSGGRKRALKILQARNDLPDSGMWRSLAS